MRGLFSARRAGRRTQAVDRDQPAAPKPGRAYSMAAYNDQTVPSVATRSGWPINNTGPSWGTVRPRRDGIGHQHLVSLLRVHDALMRGGGVAAAVTTLTMREIAQAVAACRYFELDTLAGLLVGVPRAASSARSARAFDSIYRARVSRGGWMADAVRRKISSRPEDFPVDPL